jgi:hypothetical protein
MTNVVEVEEIEEALRPCTPQEEYFAQLYHDNPNAAWAYKTAFGGGMSNATAASNGYKVKRRPWVRDYLQALEADRIERLKVSRARLEQEMARMALVDPGAFFDEKGGLVPLASLSRDDRAAIAGIKTKELKDRDGNVEGKLREIKLTDKRAAVMDLAKLMGYLKDEEVADDKAVYVVVVPEKAASAEEWAARYAPAKKALPAGKGVKRAR